MTVTVEGGSVAPVSHEADHVFLELTRSICQECRRVIDAHVLLRDCKVYLH